MFKRFIICLILLSSSAVYANCPTIEVQCHYYGIQEAHGKVPVSKHSTDPRKELFVEWIDVEYAQPYFPGSKAINIFVPCSLQGCIERGCGHNIQNTRRECAAKGGTLFKENEIPLSADLFGNIIHSLQELGGSRHRLH